MKVIRSANRKTNVAPASNFTGTVLNETFTDLTTTCSTGQAGPCW